MADGSERESETRRGGDEMQWRRDAVATRRGGDETRWRSVRYEPRVSFRVRGKAFVTLFA